MEVIFGGLFGIIVGITVGASLLIKPFEENRETIKSQRNKLRRIAIEVSKQQFNSVENLQNKIKSILSDCESKNSTL